MSQTKSLLIFGEALFDCFAFGEKVLGGAPFNVAWHMQALGDKPQFISRVGEDTLGQTILAEMTRWDMDTSTMQQDPQHPTGRVNVTLNNTEPSYDIATDSAWDYIAMDPVLSRYLDNGVLYHGTLAGRSSVSRQTLETLTADYHLDIFIDINLRAPWWDKELVFQWLERARWVKLNQHELSELGFKSADLKQDMTRLHTHFHLDQLIVTCGEKGAVVRDEEGEFHQIQPGSSENVIDTVGAGDAFSAAYLHGLLQGWPVKEMLQRAQDFASQIVSQRGAISDNLDLYNKFN